MKRKVRFGETDAAGVIHFHNLLRWCHEAWEESLDRYGVHSADVFPDVVQGEESLKVDLQIVHCGSDFLMPIKAGGHLKIILHPKKIDNSSFYVQSDFQCEGQKVALGLIRHLAIDIKTRKRCELPEKINLWLEASSVNLGPMSV